MINSQPELGTFSVLRPGQEELIASVHETVSHKAEMA